MKTVAYRFGIVRRALMLAVLMLITVTAHATTFITDVKLIGGTSDKTNELKTTLTNQGWKLIDYDLNEDCGSGTDYIYLLYKEDENTDGVNRGYITDFYISSEGDVAVNSHDVDGRTYYLTDYDGDDHFKEKKGDLNSNTGHESANIHLYYTKDLFPDYRAITGITFNDTSTVAVGWNGDNSKPADLNAGCGSESAYIYMHITTDVATVPGSQPTGRIDACTGGAGQITVTGWAYDPDASAQSIDVQIKVYKSNGTTHYKTVEMKADRPRNDVNNQFSITGKHGYSATIDIADAGTYKVMVYAIDTNGDGNSQIGSTRTVTVTPCVRLTSETGEVTLQNGDVLTGTGGANTHVTIAAGATVTLSGVDITSISNDDSHQWAGITCAGNATIILADGTTNSVKGGHRYYPGIYVPEGNTLTIRGSGTLNASGSGTSAGIGGGYIFNCGNIVIEGGVINATAVGPAAGIGGGNGRTCGDITITGGTITATGANGGAGIGGVQGCGNITITTGVTLVTATKGHLASYSIGARDYSGTVTIGGVVTGSISESPYTFDTSTLTYIVSFNANGGDGNMAIQSYKTGIAQSLYGCSFTRPGYDFTGWNTKADGSGTAYTNGQNISVSNNMTLYAQWRLVTYTVTFLPNGGSGTMDAQIYMKDIAQELNNCVFSRRDYTFTGWNTKADGSGTSYSNRQSIIVNGNTTLYAQWKECRVIDLSLVHGNDIMITPYAVVFKAIDGDIITGWSNGNVMVQIASGATITLRNAHIDLSVSFDLRSGIETLGDAAIILEGYSFVKGRMNKPGILSYNTLIISGNGALEVLGNEIDAIYGNVTFDGDFIDNSYDNSKRRTILSRNPHLPDDADYSSMIGFYNGKSGINVTLSGRTLYKDDTWNTLCLPFNLSAEQVASQLAPSKLMTLSSSTFSGGVLTLNFEDATSIEAGKPYIIKWASGQNITDPTFTGVTISNTTAPIETQLVKMIGTYKPFDSTTDLLLDSHNPDNGAFRAALSVETQNFGGLTFGGWFTDAQFKTPVTTIPFANDGTVKLYGKFTNSNTTVTLAKEGYSTYYNSLADAVLPAGMKARIVTARADGTTLTYQTIADGSLTAVSTATVPAGTAVMLQVAQAGNVQDVGLTLTAPAATPVSQTNLLHGSDEAAPTTGGGEGAMYYKLSYNTEGQDIGWYWGAENGGAFQSAAHKAWLALPSGAGAPLRSIGLPGFDDNTTDIPLIPYQNERKQEHWDVWYDLYGRRLEGRPAVNGLYIHNGEKVNVTDR